jgi:predicted nucleotidyltransferase
VRGARQKGAGLNVAGVWTKIECMITVSEIRDLVSQAAERYDIKSVRLFGSYADGRATDESDIDLLVEYNHQPTMLNFFGFQNYLQDKLNTNVDVIEYPIEEEYLFYKDFEIGATVSLYG